MHGGYTPCALKTKSGPERRTLFKVERTGMAPAFVVADDVIEVVDTIRACEDLNESRSQILSITQVAGSAYVWVG